jgi:hypothetical protein
MAQKINLGLAVLREKAISLKTFRRDWVKLKNPDAENLQVLAEQVYLNEEVIKKLTPIALESTGADTLRKVWEMVQNPFPEPVPAQPGQPGQMPGMPAQMPGNPVPLPPGNPGQPPGLPPSALPPAAATGNPLTNLQVAQVNPMAAQMNQLLAALNGGAQGGAGGGGLPPIPGRTSPVPLTPAPGAAPGRLVF